MKNQYMILTIYLQWDIAEAFTSSDHFHEPSVYTCNAQTTTSQTFKFSSIY